ncbi:unnamed protein product [Protopolystoma xenopodis]|uniref:Uncharacterized protein n=1 Tax=Protopolystoma xenopodis TaxID=117903 RepID=A0A448WV10_9PLAT|nr:unnamed protein product [Protopolystoma xenopodis]
MVWIRAQQPLEWPLDCLGHFLGHLQPPRLNNVVKRRREDQNIVAPISIAVSFRCIEVTNCIPLLPVPEECLDVCAHLSGFSAKLCVYPNGHLPAQPHAHAHTDVLQMHQHGYTQTSGRTNGWMDGWRCAPKVERVHRKVCGEVWRPGGPVQKRMHSIPSFDWQNGHPLSLDSNKYDRSGALTIRTQSLPFSG